jgi:SAM-dependent methyltransferase
VSLALPAVIVALLRCPACHGSLAGGGEGLTCRACGAVYPVLDGLVRLRTPAPEDPITARVRAFYEGNPFPGYDGLDDPGSLRAKAHVNSFTRLLDAQVPFGATVLEVGCGTGQLTNLLALAHRTVVGTDLSLASLGLAESFRRRHDIARAGFLQMDLFHPCFAPGSFDLVICTGVLHHTADPRRGLAALAPLVNPGGHLIVGLYHRFGRLGTHLRRALFRLGAPRRLDPRLASLDPARAATWFADQYENPHESAHTLGALRAWMEEAGLTWIRSLPSPHPFEPPLEEGAIFLPEAPAPPLERALTEALMAFSGSREGGFFLGIARRSVGR